MWFVWHGHRELSWLHTEELPPRAWPCSVCGVPVSGWRWAVLVTNCAVPTLYLKCWEPWAHRDTCKELCQGSCGPWAQRPFPEQEVELDPGNGCTGASRSPPGDLQRPRLGTPGSALITGMVSAVGHKWWWHCSWWPFGHPGVLFPEGGSGLSQIIPVVEPRMCSSPEGSMSGVSGPCVSSGLRESRGALSHWAAATSAPWECHPPPPQAGATGWSCLRIHSRASRHLWGSGTQLPPWGEAEDPLMPPS